MLVFESFLAPAQTFGLNVRVHEDNIEVHASLPGVPKEAIQVSIRDRDLVVEVKPEANAGQENVPALVEQVDGEDTSQAKPEKSPEWKWTTREFVPVSSGRRVVRFNTALDPESAQVRYEHGVLVVTLQTAAKKNERVLMLS